MAAFRNDLKNADGMILGGGQLLHDQTHEVGMAVIVVTHNREIARVADRVIELSSGSVVSDAPNEGGPAPISELQW